jgi:erythromycin esterase
MRLRTILTIVWLCQDAICGRAQSDSTTKPLMPPPGAIAEATAWAAAHAVPLATCEAGNGFADLQALTKIIGNRPVVALGEGMHNTHEHLAFRNRLFEFLVERMGFTAIAVETGYSESVAADDYVLGRGVNRRKAATAVFSWAHTPSEESAQLIDWMRAYNARPGTRRPVRFYGMDLSGGRNGTFPEARLAVDAALQYLTTVDRERGRQLHLVLGSLIDRFNTAGYPTLSQQERNTISGALADMMGLFERDQIRYIRISSSAEYHRAYQHAVVARQLDMNLRAQTREDVQPLRDASMARNLMWILQREGPDGRVLVFAANTHVRKWPRESDLGHYLNDLLGSRMIVIGSFFNRGAAGYEGGETRTILPSSDPSLNTVFMEGVRKPFFLLDLGNLPREGPFADWLAKGKPAWNHRFAGNPAMAFDALVVIDTISPLRPLK